MKYKFRVYMSYTVNIPMMNRAIDAVAKQIRQFSTEERPILILNNSMVSIMDQIENKTDCQEIFPCTPLQCATTSNWMIRLAHDNEEPFCMEVQQDAVLYDGAIETAIAKFEEVKDTKWIAIHANGGFEIKNINFYYTENVWYDDFLFPFYYTDNHMYRISTLRGWPVIRIPCDLALHESSHCIRDDPVLNRRNHFAFPAHGNIYSQVWGGPPGQERINDPYANGTLPRN